MTLHHLEIIALEFESANFFNLEFTENYSVFEIHGVLTLTSFHLKDFHEISYLSIFSKIGRENSSFIEI